MRANKRKASNIIIIIINIFQLYKDRKGQGTKKGYRLFTISQTQNAKIISATHGRKKVRELNNTINLGWTNRKSPRPHSSVPPPKANRKSLEKLGDGLSW